VAILFVPAPASALIINMESLPSGSCANIGPTTTTQGFSFSANANLFACNGNANALNPTRALLDANDQSIVTMSAADASLFDLISFDSGSRLRDGEVHPTQGSSQVQVVGNLTGGGTVSTTFAFDGIQFRTFLLPSSFTNLSSVVFTGLGSAESPEMLLDNISVTSTAAVPGPVVGAGLPGLIMALGGFLAWRRSRKAATVIA
jgi:hypothetical protein